MFIFTSPYDLYLLVMSKKTEKSRKDKNQQDAVAESTRCGVFIFKDKSRYDGEYKEIEGVIYRHGSGKYQTSETLYSGQWEMDKMTGKGYYLMTKGRLEFASGAVFEGNWKDNQFQGAGTYTWSNGSSLIGDWQENCAVGPAKYVDPEGHGWVGMMKRGSKAILAPELY